jgi:hypothetical protein
MLMGTILDITNCSLGEFMNNMRSLLITWGVLSDQGQGKGGASSAVVAAAATSSSVPAASEKDEDSTAIDHVAIDAMTQMAREAQAAHLSELHGHQSLAQDLAAMDYGGNGGNGGNVVNGGNDGNDGNGATREIGDPLGDLLDEPQLGVVSSLGGGSPSSMNSFNSLSSFSSTNAAVRPHRERGNRDGDLSSLADEVTQMGRILQLERKPLQVRPSPYNPPHYLLY